MATAVPDMTTPVQQAISAWPEPAQAVAKDLRRLVFEVAEDTGTGPLTETLKWGQPAYLNSARRVGTTIRLGYAAGEEDPLRLLVHCGTTLVDSYRERFGKELSFQGNRAICLSETGDLPEEPLRQCIAMALGYHVNKETGRG